MTHLNLDKLTDGAKAFIIYSCGFLAAYLCKYKSKCNG
jgi:hypothetical protein